MKKNVKNAQELYRRLQPVMGHEAFMAAVTVNMNDLENVYIRKRQKDIGLTVKGAKFELAMLLDGIVDSRTLFCGPNTGKEGAK